MSDIQGRTLDDDERRRIGAKRLASALDRNTSPRLHRRQPHGAADRSAGRRRPDRGRTPTVHAFGARDVLPLLAVLPGKIGTNTALCAAMAGWSVGLVLSLMFLEVVRW